MIFRRKDPLQLAYGKYVMAFTNYHDTGKLELPDGLFRGPVSRMLQAAKDALQGTNITPEVRADLCRIFEAELKRIHLVPRDRVAQSLLSRLCMTYVVTELQRRGLAKT